MMVKRQIRGENCYRRPWNWIEMMTRKRKKMKAGVIVRMEKNKGVGEPKGKQQTRGAQHIDFPIIRGWLRLFAFEQRRGFG